MPEKPEVKAGDKGTVTVTVTNKGKEPINRLIAATFSDNPIFDGKELIYGQLLSGQSRSWKMNFEIPKWVNTRNDKIDLKFFKLTTSKFPGPVLTSPQSEMTNLSMHINLRLWMTADSVLPVMATENLKEMRIFPGI